MVLWRRLGWGAEGFPLMDPPTREKLYEYPLHSQFAWMHICVSCIVVDCMPGSWDC